MKWKDIKLATLQKMFSAEGNNIPSDDSTRDYLAGMPYTANEGLMMMCTDKRHIVKSVDIDNTMGEPVGGFLLSVPAISLFLYLLPFIPAGS